MLTTKIMYLQSVSIATTLAISFLVAACTEHSPVESPHTCEEASARFESCAARLGQEDFSPAECEALVVDVELLCGADKADGFGSWMCDAGLLSYCVVPQCDAPAVVAGDACEQYIGANGCASCDYYLCKEAADKSCGDDGYYVGFGHKYCERLTLVTEPRLSVEGQAWSAATRECLMLALERDSLPSDSCDEIAEIAFASHPGCYLDMGVCDLPLSDLWKVVTTIDSDDYQIRQILGVGVGCLSEWL